MIAGGDEISRTQLGNNNAYCQDNELSWYDWDLDERKRSLLDFTRRLIQIPQGASRCCGVGGSSEAGGSGGWTSRTSSGSGPTERR